MKKSDGISSVFPILYLFTLFDIVIEFLHGGPLSFYLPSITSTGIILTLQHGICEIGEFVVRRSSILCLCLIFCSMPMQAMFS